MKIRGKERGKPSPNPVTSKNTPVHIWSLKIWKLQHTLLKYVINATLSMEFCTTKIPNVIYIHGIFRYNAP
jgi:hypothetical protein